MKKININLSKSLKPVSIEKMTEDELNFGLALLMDKRVKVEKKRVLVLNDKKVWEDYDPLNNWNQLGEVLQNNPLVVSTHENYDQNDKKIGYWYSCHAFFAGTSFKGLKYAEVIGKSGVALMLINVKNPIDD